MTTDTLQVNIAVSRQKDGLSVAEDLIEKTNKCDEQPKALFLFSTIHYESEFDNILSSLRNCFSEIPLIGGSVSGFMTHDGCFTRGVVLLCLYGDKLEVETAIGHNTKKNPRKAVKKVMKSLRDQPKYKNNIVVEFAPTAVIPNIPGLGQKNVILSSAIGNQLVKTIPLMTKLNYGFDRADEILDYLAEAYPDRLVIGGCTMDDNKMLGSFQFCNDQITKHSLVAMNVSFPHTVGFETIQGCKPLDKTFHITELSADKHVIKKLNGKSARKHLFDELNIEITEPKRTHQLFKKSFYYPLGFKENGIWHSVVIGIIYGDSLIGGSQIKEKDLTLLSLSVGSIYQNIRKHLEHICKKDISLLFGFACETFLETLGGRMYHIHEEFEKLKAPFLVVFLSGESFSHPDYGSHHLYESLNLFTIEKNA